MGGPVDKCLQHGSNLVFSACLDVWTTMGSATDPQEKHICRTYRTTRLSNSMVNSDQVSSLANILRRRAKGLGLIVVNAVNCT